MVELKRSCINQDETRVLSPLPTTYIYSTISILLYVTHSCPPLTTTSSPHVSLYLLRHHLVYPSTYVIRTKTNRYKFPGPTQSSSSFPTPSFVIRHKTFHDADHLGLNEIKKRLVEYLTAVHLKELNVDKEAFEAAAIASARE